jgi:hypothetical protein
VKWKSNKKEIPMRFIPGDCLRNTRKSNQEQIFQMTNKQTNNVFYFGSFECGFDWIINRQSHQKSQTGLKFG